MMISNHIIHNKDIKDSINYMLDDGITFSLITTSIPKSRYSIVEIESLEVGRPIITHELWGFSDSNFKLDEFNKLTEQEEFPAINDRKNLTKKECEAIKKWKPKIPKRRGRK